MNKHEKLVDNVDIQDEKTFLQQDTQRKQFPGS